jgi:hypothetical protein
MIFPSRGSPQSGDDTEPPTVPSRRTARRYARWTWWYRTYQCSASARAKPRRWSASASRRCRVRRGRLDWDAVVVHSRHAPVLLADLFTCLSPPCADVGCVERWGHAGFRRVAHDHSSLGWSAQR